MANDGTVYVGCGTVLCAVTNAGGFGSNKWTIPSSANVVIGSPAIGSDGTIYAAAGDLYATEPNGTQRWSYPLGDANAAPAIGRDNTVYVASYTILHAVDADGKLRWTNNIGTINGSPALAADGSVYLTTVTGDALYKVSPSGVRVWSLPLRVPPDSPALGRGGTIYLNGQDGLFSISPQGATNWQNADARSFGVAPSSSAAIGRDETIYVAAIANYEVFGYGFRLYAIAPSGAAKWQISTNLHGTYGATLGAPAVDSGGTIYYAAYTRLFAFSPDGNVLWTFDAGADPNILNGYTYTSPTIGSDGTIYATFGSRLYAFAGTNALADSPWPMYRQNPRHTGKVEKPSLQKPQKRSDANFQFELFGQISNTFNIEASTNLTGWTSVTSFVATTVPMDVPDLSATNFPARFYRAVDTTPPAAERARK